MSSHTKKGQEDFLDKINRIYRIGREGIFMSLRHPDLREACTAFEEAQ
jgi:hypothetical protein